ncbi:hypothetical protein CRUP_022870 [Coryphaenoides rupestris]|nr:hypothetical protein CRUP_022870 [Coryphaenoides rupestris]
MINFCPITSGYRGYGWKPSNTPEPQSQTQPSLPPPPQLAHLDNGHIRANTSPSYSYGNCNSHGNGHGNGTSQYNNPASLHYLNGSNGDHSLPGKMGGLRLARATHSSESHMMSPGGRNGSGFNPESDVYRMLQDPDEPVSQPKQSGSFKYLQGILEADDGGRT